MSTHAQNRPVVVLINTFQTKPGRLDEFIVLQTAALDRFRGRIPGWRGGRLLRAIDGNGAVLMSVFDSVESHRRFVDGGQLTGHRDRVLPLLDRVEPAFYEIVSESGAV